MTVVRNSVTVSMDSCFLNIQMVLGVVLVNQFKTTQTRTLTLSCCIHTGRREKRRNTTESAAEGIEREGRTTRCPDTERVFFKWCYCCRGDKRVGWYQGPLLMASSQRTTHTHFLRGPLQLG